MSNYQIYDHFAISLHIIMIPHRDCDPQVEKCCFKQFQNVL